MFQLVGFEVQSVGLVFQLVGFSVGLGFQFAGFKVQLVFCSGIWILMYMGLYM